MKVTLPINKISGQFFGLVLGDGTLLKRYLQFASSNPSYVKKFLENFNYLFSIDQSNFRFYLQANSKKTNELILKWERELTFLKQMKYKRYFKKIYAKGTLKIMYFNAKFCRSFLLSFKKIMYNIPSNKMFLKGFIDGIIATEGHAEIKKKRIVITQNIGIKSDFICNALKKLKIHFFIVKNKNKKLLIRITRKNNVLKVVKFCEISSDKLYNFLKIKKWISSPHFLKTISLLSYLQKNKNATRQDLINKLKMKNPNFLFYAKSSPLHKHKFVIKTGKPYKLILTQKGIKFLKNSSKFAI